MHPEKQVSPLIRQQQSMTLCPYIELYHLIIPKDNMLRQVNELVDFSFVYDELKEHYCKVDESLKTKFSAKNTTDVLEDEIAYCQKLIAVLESEGGVCQLPKVQEMLNLLKETVVDDLEQLQTLIEKNKIAGVEVKMVIGDTTYSEKENIKYSSDNDIELAAN
ncbi:hypothetical protein BM613_09455 [Sulfoacidibacillus thermotolerans]|uniref:Uncharacterized protein n=1 Tax=Sulfoacidibacillus thermotolerans TaxID=1765684 RepID=A0A2U3D7S3_SULT2|nr:hypothetical protein BM613_09455 [Sulfoacidibacillus thermotolerans]